jgi:hypothetical protein
MFGSLLFTKGEWKWIKRKCYIVGLRLFLTKSLKKTLYRDQYCRLREAIKMQSVPVQ